MMQNSQRSNHCWSYFWFLFLLTKKKRRTTRNTEAE